MKGRSYVQTWKLYIMQSTLVNYIAFTIDSPVIDNWSHHTQVTSWPIWKMWSIITITSLTWKSGLHAERSHNLLTLYVIGWEWSWLQCSHLVECVKSTDKAVINGSWLSADLAQSARWPHPLLSSQNPVYHLMILPEKGRVAISYQFRSRYRYVQACRLPQFSRLLP